MTAGDTISRYRIVGPLGKGGMGIVYQADDTRLHRPVALKFLPSDSLTENDKQRFLNEARAAAAVRHPNICTIYDIDEAEGEVFIAMAYLDGETLQRRIARGPLKPSRVIDIAIQVASGLESAHLLGIVHRDIKSANIMLSRDGQVFILDFGLALRSGGTRLTAVGASVGTPAYMSPEQAQGHDVDQRTDLWSLGVVMFEMLTGSLPFRRENSAATLFAIVYEEPPSATSLRPTVPPALARIVEKTLEKQPDKRWQTAHEMIGHLKEIPDPSTLPTQALTMNPQIAVPIAFPVPASRRRPVMVAVAIGSLLLVGAAAGIYVIEEMRNGAPISLFGRRLPDEKQVAVLPFQVVGSSENTRTVSDGLVEILTAALSDFERFQGKITAVPSSEVRRRNIASAEEARRTYGVNLAITGSAQPAADKVQFTINLVDAVKLRQIGSRTFVYDPAQPLVSRDQAVNLMVRLLSVDVPPAARAAVALGDSSAPGAYTAYLEGRGLLARYDVRGNIDKAIAAFQRATAQDTNYALAFAGLGEAYWRKTLTTGEKQWAALAISNAEHAVHLDDGLAIVHSVLGEVYETAGREQDAVRELQRALALAPNNAEAPRQLAEVYTNLGRFSEAETLYVQAAKSRPTDWYGYLLLGFFYKQRERYAEAETQFKQAMALTPDNEIVYRNLSNVYLLQGRYEDAVRELHTAIRIAPKSNPTTYQALGATYFLQHRFREAVDAAETAIDLDATRYSYWGNLGIYYKWTPGNEAKSASALQKAIDLGSKFLETMPTDYDVHANMAEYRARLGDTKGALAEIGRIPPPARGSRTGNLAIAYELTGHRDKAIELIRASLTKTESLNQIKDDPDLTGLWNDPAFQKAIRQR